MLPPTPTTIFLIILGTAALIGAMIVAKKHRDLVRLTLQPGPIDILPPPPPATNDLGPPAPGPANTFQPLPAPPPKFSYYAPPPETTAPEKKKHSFKLTIRGLSPKEPSSFVGSRTFIILGVLAAVLIGVIFYFAWFLPAVTH